LYSIRMMKSELLSSLYIYTASNSGVILSSLVTAVMLSKQTEGAHYKA